MILTLEDIYFDGPKYLGYMRGYRGHPLLSNYKGETHGISTLIATLTTISTLLILGIFLISMAISVTPRDIPAIGALESTRNSPGNYTVSVIALTNSAIKRNQVMVDIQPDDSAVKISKITGSGDYLGSGDTFTVSNLDPKKEYTVLIEYKATGSVIASLVISPT
jgi:hypothetical protein